MLRPLSPEAAEQVRQVFSAAGYTAARFLESPALRDVQRWWLDPARAMEHTRGTSAWNTLLRCFVLGIRIDEEELAETIPPPVIRTMLDCGMLSRQDGGISSNVLLTPCDEMLFAADRADRIGRESGDALVVWPNPTTRLLQQFSIRRFSRSTLDLGAGCGLQGLMAKAYSDEVVCTDLNPRAAEFVHFNAALNGLGGIECLTGDTFEPAQGRSFDLILANLPFFVSPSSGQMYCENSLQLDQYCRRVVREVPPHLNEGGYFQAVLEWVRVTGQDWQERLAEWVEGSGCDAWVLRSYSEEPAAYAEQRIRAMWPGEPLSDRFQQWMEYYRLRGVEEIHGGMLAMRKRSERNWLRIEELPADPREPFGDTVLEAFAIQDVLSLHPTDEELLSYRPRLSPAAELEQRSHVSGRSWAVSSLKLHLNCGLPASLPIESAVAAFLARLDGAATLRETADQLAQSVNAPPDQVRQQCCSVIRRLAERRFVHFAG